MINHTISMECLTPCFCAGANQSHAEIRPAAIRGALRWWLRALGGGPEQESAVFGGTDPVQASSVMVRVANLIPKGTGELPQVGKGPGKLNPTDPLAYILYFASVAGAKDGATYGSGPRWSENGSLGPKTRFDLIIRQTRKLDSTSLQLFEGTILAFKHFGAIGLRVTRGLGALQAIDTTPQSFEQTTKLLEDHEFIMQLGSRRHNDWISLMKEAGNFLKNELRSEYGAGGNKKPANATALGSINPCRQTSALYLRPTKRDGQLQLMAFEAPHGRVLGNESRNAHNKPILKEIPLR